MIARVELKHIPRRLRDVRRIDAEVRAQRGAGVAAAEAVHRVTAR